MADSNNTQQDWEDIDLEHGEYFEYGSPMMRGGRSKPCYKHGVTPGYWSLDIDNALKYAKANNKPFMIDLTKDGGCAYCKGADDNYHWQDFFTDWLKQKQLISIRAAYANIDYKDALFFITHFSTFYIGNKEKK